MRGPKMDGNGGKWAKKWPKMTKNGQKWPKLAGKWAKMANNGQKWLFFGYLGPLLTIFGHFYQFFPILTFF